MHSNTEESAAGFPHLRWHQVVFASADHVPNRDATQSYVSRDLVAILTCQTPEALSTMKCGHAAFGPETRYQTFPSHLSIFGPPSTSDFLPLHAHLLLITSGERFWLIPVLISASPLPVLEII
jgi:hypothetical protein